MHQAQVWITSTYDLEICIGLFVSLNMITLLLPSRYFQLWFLANVGCSFNPFHIENEGKENPGMIYIIDGQEIVFPHMYSLLRTQQLGTLIIDASTMIT